MATKTKKKSISLFAALALSVLSFGAFSFATGLLSQDRSGLAAVSHAQDGEDGDDGDDEQDEDEKADKEAEKAEKAEKERVKKLKEAQREKYKLERERLKKEGEVLREKKRAEWEAMRTKRLEQNKDDEERSAKAEAAAEELAERKADLLEDIAEELVEAEERIMEAQAEGADVSKALATLAQAKAKAEEAKAASETASLDALRRLAREAKKLAHFASHKEVKLMEHVEKNVQKIAKHIERTEGKIALLESLGGDGGSFRGSVDEIKADYESAKTLIAHGGEDRITGIGQLDGLERRIKAIKSSVENALYAMGGTDEKYDDDYENEAKELAEELNDVAEIEGDELGAKIKSLAHDQLESAKRVGSSVEKIDQRNRVLQFLFGTRKAELEKLEGAIRGNEERIAQLTVAAQSIEDAEVKEILEGQIAALEQENEKLQTFVSGQKDRLSLFGWLINLDPGQS